MIPFPWNLMFRHKIRHVELLNRIGEVLDIGLGTSEGYPWVVARLRAILEVDALVLWVFDRRHQLLVKEAQSSTADFQFSPELRRYDEHLANWQLKHKTALSLQGRQPGPTGAATFPTSYQGMLVSLPLTFQDDGLGALNMYFGEGDQRLLDRNLDPGKSELLRAIAGQMAVFAHTRSQVANSTFYKEIHHRVKNNLQTVASLLRMQLRRLDEITPERALSESIQRIMSIALVHETLSQGEIGMVDLLQLAERIKHLASDSFAGRIEVGPREQPRILVNSKQATSIALVINELIDNAIKHGADLLGDTAVNVQLGLDSEQVTAIVSNRGRELPADFNLEHNSNLGLTIVSTLVKEELKGRFSLYRDGDITHARVTFPRADGSPNSIEGNHEL